MLLVYISMSRDAAAGKGGGHDTENIRGFRYNYTVGLEPAPDLIAKVNGMRLEMVLRMDVWAIVLGLTGLILLSMEQALGFF